MTVKDIAYNRQHDKSGVKVGCSAAEYIKGTNLIT